MPAISKGTAKQSFSCLEVIELSHLALSNGRSLYFLVQMLEPDEGPCSGEFFDDWEGNIRMMHLQNLDKPGNNPFPWVKLSLVVGIEVLLKLFDGVQKVF